jgi:hypothetical protein
MNGAENRTKDLHKILFYSDAPPLVEGGHGNHGIARNIVRALDGRCGLVLARRFSRRIRKEDIREASAPAPVHVFKDVSGLGFRRLLGLMSDVLDLFALFFQLPTIRRKAVSQSCGRTLILLGAKPSSLWFIPILAKLGLPVDVYLVDDFEESARKRGKRLLARLIPLMEKRCLRKADRVFVISEGYSEHLKKKYGIASRFLPLPVPMPPADFRPLGTPNPLSRTVVFTGGLNFLYTTPLRELYEVVTEWNEKKPFKIFIHVLTYQNPDAFLETLPDRRYIRVDQNLPVEQRLNILRESWACFLPYSFEDDEKIMVSTSFSCKIMEYYEAGRPILVYGPSYASIPRYFRDYGLGILVTDRKGLADGLEALEKMDEQRVVSAYGELWKKLHSPESFCARLAEI